MATQIWRGGTAANIRQTATLVLSGSWSTSDTITVTINNVSLTLTVGSTTSTTGIASALKSWYQGTDPADASSFTISAADSGAQGVPQFAEQTATVSSSTVTFTANGAGALAGKPFTMTAAKSSSGTISYTNAVTSPAGQYHGDSAANWSGNAGPEDSDTVIFDSGSFDWRWGLDTYASGPSTSNPTTITKYKAYSGNVGLAYINADSSSKSYPEYRTRYFTTDAGAAANCTANLEVGDGPGSGRFMWNAGSGQSTVTVFGKGTRIDNGVPCILWKGTHASNVFNNIGGDVGIAFFGGETATVATLVTGSDATSQAQTTCGSGCTLTTVTLNGGTQATASAITTANQYAGTWTHSSGTVTTANIYGGTHYPTGGSTYTTLKLFGGTFDCSKGNASFTITNTVELYAGAKFIDRQGRSGSPVFHLNGCTLADVTILLPDGKTYTIS